MKTACALLAVIGLFSSVQASTRDAVVPVPGANFSSSGIGFIGNDDTPPPEPIFVFGKPTLNGNGCPKDTVAVIPSTDGQSMSILFSTFSAETTPTQNRDRKTCNMIVPVTVKKGMSIGVYRVDYRGNAFVPQAPGAYAEFSTESFFAGQQGPVNKKHYDSGASEDFFVSDEVPVATMVWTACGAATNFRINTNLIAYKSVTREGDEVKISLDTMDATVEHGFRYHIRSRRCQQ